MKKSSKKLLVIPPFLKKFQKTQKKSYVKKSLKTPGNSSISQEIPENFLEGFLDKISQPFFKLPLEDTLDI